MFPGCLCLTVKMSCYLYMSPYNCVVSVNRQGLQRRATPHPSELKVMKNVIEARRNEPYVAKPDGELESPESEVNK